MTVEYVWAGFILLVVALLALDLGVFHRRPHAIRFKEAMGWTAFWIALALLFSIFVYFAYENKWMGLGENLDGGDATMEYLAGYVIEKSLSLDNIFVMAIIFAHFRIPNIYQHRVLFWGILGALVFRGIMIAIGLAAIKRFDWVMYVFGGLLVFTAVKMLLSADETPDPHEGRLVKVLSRFLPLTKQMNGSHFTIRIDGKTFLTPLALVLLIIELSDVMFAVDSIPAVFAITLDPFLVFTSNVFAILGLRALYFALAGLLDRFHYLKLALVFVLGFVGVKMILVHHVKIPTPISLGVIVGLLAIGAIASALMPPPPESPEYPDPTGPFEPADPEDVVESEAETANRRQDEPAGGSGDER
jgi:tellurite resistance protein TerC